MDFSLRYFHFYFSLPRVIILSSIFGKVVLEKLMIKVERQTSKASKKKFPSIVVSIQRSRKLVNFVVCLWILGEGQE